MSPSRRFALLAIVPAVALAQTQALDGARDVARVQAEGTARRTRVSDAALAEAPAASPKAPDGSVDLGRAAARLEAGEPPEAEPVAADDDAGRHTVQRGDTLWDISGKYLQDPYAWPKVWSYNPEIPNPHRILPGQEIRLVPPARAPAAGERTPAREDEVAGDDLLRPELAGDELKVVGPYQIGLPQVGGHAVRRDTFVTRDELQQAGAISSAFEEKLLLSTDDRVYVRFARDAAVQPGQRYLVFEPVAEVVHPVTRKPFGVRTEILGTAEVLSVDGAVATARIASAYAPIERGARVAPYADRLTGRVTEKANRVAVKGVIVAAQKEGATQIGNQEFVFLDKGSADGVEDGNVFTVVRNGDPVVVRTLQRVDRKPLPDEVVGGLVVVDAREHSSTALVVRSDVELAVGDRVEMRVAAPAASPGPATK